MFKLVPSLHLPATVIKLHKSLLWTSFNLVRFTSTTRGRGSGSAASTRKPPEPPSNCCMSGCANCVWMKYADELIQFYQDGGAKAKQELDRMICDPTLKMFLKMELISKLNENK